MSRLHVPSQESQQEPAHGWQADDCRGSSDMPGLADLLERTAKLHHHLCPRQVLGVRAGMLAARLLALDLPQTDKRLFTFVETDGCFADGIAVATGCWFGRRTLRLVDEGKAAVTCVDTLTQRAVRIWPNPEARRAALRYAPDAERPWHSYLAAYQSMPDHELLSARPVRLAVSLAAIISRPGARTCCTRCGEEIMNEREIVREGGSFCRSCVGDRYYHDG